jgi:hypothetical protein
MFGENKANENWRKQYNKELTQLFGVLGILSFVRICQLNWIGNVNTFAPRGVLLLRGLSRHLSGQRTVTPQFSKTCLKKGIGAIGFRFVPLDSSMFVDSVTVFPSCKPC